MFMKWPAIGFWAVAAEVLAHLLSLGWGFAMLTVAFVWTAGMLRTTSVKAQTTEARVSALIQVVNGMVPKSGSSTISGNLTVSGTVAGNSGISAPSSQLGSAHVNSSLGSGALVVDNNASVGSLTVGGTAMTFPVTRAGGLTSAPTSYTQAWGNSVVSFCTAMNTQLGAAGVFV